jgi:predicted metal-binding protein
MIVPLKDTKPEELAFLVTKALELEAIDAKIIPTYKVFVEKRVVLKCRGCIGYGKKLTCPPHVPTVDDFREILKEYRYALLVKFRSPAVADEEIAKAPYKTWLDPTEPEETREKAAKFWSDYFDYSKKMMFAMLELEKTAFNEGFTFAVAFVNGSCRLCEKCNVEKGICLHSNMARIPEHAVGINMKKTAAESDMPLQFPIKGQPEPMSILLID